MLSLFSFYESVKLLFFVLLLCKSPLFCLWSVKHWCICIHWVFLDDGSYGLLTSLSGWAVHLHPHIPFSIFPEYTVSEVNRLIWRNREICNTFIFNVPNHLHFKTETSIFNIDLKQDFVQCVLMDDQCFQFLEPSFIVLNPWKCFFWGFMIIPNKRCVCVQTKKRLNFIVNKRSDVSPCF